MAAEEPKERRTVQSSLTKIRGVLDEAFTSLGLPSTSDKPSGDVAHHINAEKLHPYGAANLQDVQRRLGEEFKFVRETLGQLRSWAAAEGDAAVTKFLTHHKDRVQLGDRMQSLQRSLQQCVEMAQRRIEEEAADAAVKGGARGPREAARALIRRVEAVAKECGYSVFPQEIENHAAHGEGEGPGVTPGSSPHASPGRPRSTPRRDDPSQQPVLMLATKNILIDVMAGHGGMIHSAKLTHINEADKTEVRDEEADRHLTELLRRGDVDGLALQLRALTRLEALDTAYPPARVRQALRSLHEDIGAVTVREEQSLIVSGTPDGAVPLEQARCGHGLARGAADGTRLLYYLPASTVAAARASVSQPAGELWAGGRALRIAAEEGASPVCLPLSSQLLPEPGVRVGPGGLPVSGPEPPPSAVSAILGHCPWGECADPGEPRPPCPVQFALLLEPPVRASVGTVRRAAALVHGPPAGDPPPAPLPASASAAAPRVSRVRAPGGAAHQYHVSEGGDRVLEVVRLPMTHGRQLLPILSLLRQELAFGELLESCAGDDAAAAPSNSHKRPRLEAGSSSSSGGAVTVELTAERPAALHCALVHPSGSGLFAVRFDVAPGGTVEVRVEAGEGEEAPCGDAAATAVARETLSVPATIAAVLAGGRPAP